jgi:hypothetical protein
VTRASRLLPVVLVALALAGCAQTSNTPGAYPDRTKPVDQQPGDVDKNDFEVWVNYESACLEANADLDEDVAQEICTCTWDAYVEEVPFEVFLDFDRTIRERIGNLGDNRSEVEAIAQNVVDDYNSGLEEGEERLDVDLVELMEGCQPQSA